MKDVDNLEGVMRRAQHPPFPEPELELLFRKNDFDNLQLDLVEANLIEAVRNIKKVNVSLVIRVYADWKVRENHIKITKSLESRGKSGNLKKI